MNDVLELTEEEIEKLVIKYLVNKPDGQWHEDTLKHHTLKTHGVDIDIRGGKRNTERFLIECKKKYHSKSADAINKEGWLVALGQIISRMTVSRVIKTGKNKGQPSRATKYGLGLYWVSAQVALRRIPKNVAEVLNLYIFSVDESGFVKQFSPSMFGIKYNNEVFHS